MGATSDFLAELLAFLGEENFEEALTNFLKNYAGRLEFSGPGEELSLKSHDVYTKWQRMVEVHLEKFAKKKGINSEELLSKLKDMTENSPAARDFMNAFISAFEFERFMELAKEYLNTGLISVHTGLCLCLEQYLEEEGNNVEDDDEASIANAIFQSIVEASDRGTHKSMEAAKKGKAAGKKGHTKSKKLASSGKGATGTSLAFTARDMKAITEFAEMMEMTPQEAVMRTIKQHLFDLRAMQAEFSKVLDFNV
mmetsp:Transcript_41565/g.50408  ORF Transcript_41565/g.50408 Transcript_41565/m.50408 type:complete len:253 (-) Transcript_41565:562-1320(-)|eukprot:CAMPEP_0197846706 /NCGR_PEP_ID=MMETSP1438-20131217/4046_1 /TAXON_ID=1461541 /ORGANISM="Pterosperma sp., Strain CCMP1384" /LENGTH=252 /DNA_ID=CAMNT_0043458445 /DNA_START=101 /DNA_END=859 /DNA_ORIENTATION=+